MKHSLAIASLLTLSTIPALGQAKTPIGLREAIRRGPSDFSAREAPVAIVPVRLDLQWIELPSKKALTEVNTPLLETKAWVNRLEYRSFGNTLGYLQDDVSGPSFSQVPALPAPERISTIKILADAREYLGLPFSVGAIAPRSSGGADWGFFSCGADGSISYCQVTLFWDKQSNITQIRFGWGKKQLTDSK